MPKKVVKEEFVVGECCGAMTLVLSQEKKDARTGLFIPLMVFGRTETKLVQRPVVEITYKPTGRNAQLFILNFCPWCGKRQAQSG